MIPQKKIFREIYSHKIRHLPKCFAGINPEFEIGICPKSSQLEMIYDTSLLERRWVKEKVCLCSSSTRNKADLN